MEIQALALIVVALGIASMLLHVQKSMQMMFGLVAFGGASTVSLSSLGGATIAPAYLFLGFYAIRLLASSDGVEAIIRELKPIRPAFLLLLLTFWAVASAFFLPRMFQGVIQVFTLSRAEASLTEVPLRPGSGNISQAIYAIGGFMMALITAVLCRKPGGYQTALRSLQIISAIDVVAGLLDASNSVTNATVILDIFHTGGYSFLTEVELGGVKRITGLMPEASVFASFSLQLFAANAVLFLWRIEPYFTGPTAAILGLLIAGSTSSAGYIGLSAFSVAFGAYAMISAGAAHRVRPILVLTFAVAAIAVAACFVLTLTPGIGNTISDIFTTALVNKSQSDSAIERGSWNTRAIGVFLETGGLGAGIGATRASNYALVLLSNLGLIGFLLFFAFILRSTMGRIAHPTLGQGRALIWAARCGVLLGLVTNLAIGTVYDLGALFYCLLGVSMSATTPGELSGVHSRRDQLRPGRQAGNIPAATAHGA